MKLEDIVKQLANRVNQPHYIEAMLQKVVKGAYDKGLQDGKELKSDSLHNVSKCSHEWRGETYDSMGFALTEYCDKCDLTRDCC